MYLFLKLVILAEILTFVGHRGWKLFHDHQGINVNDFDYGGNNLIDEQ